MHTRMNFIHLPEFLPLLRFALKFPPVPTSPQFRIEYFSCDD